MLSGVVLAGGRGSRFRGLEKCLTPVCGIPLLFRVAGALAQVVDRLYVATTARHVAVVEAASRWGLGLIFTPGLGYERDVVYIANLAPVVVAACDIVNLSPLHLRALLNNEVLATAIAEGEYVGLFYLPSADFSKWVEIEVGGLRDVDTYEDWEAAERDCPTAYPLYVDVDLLKPHEQILEARSYTSITPIAVDYKTAVVLDGHHRLDFLKRRGLPAPVLFFDYSVLEVNVSKEEVVRRALAGELFPPKTTWHTYKGRHISELPTIEVKVEELVSRRRR